MFHGIPGISLRLQVTDDGIAFERPPGTIWIEFELCIGGRNIGRDLCLFPCNLCSADAAA
jgi:hypothetical protein